MTKTNKYLFCLLFSIIFLLAFSHKDKPLIVFAVKNSDNSIERIFRYETNAINYINYYKESHNYKLEILLLEE